MTTTSFHLGLQRSPKTSLQRSQNRRSSSGILRTSLRSTSSPEQSYTVKLNLPPLGIIFEEINPGLSTGVLVSGFVENSQGDLNPLIQPGDILTTTTAVKIESGSSKYSLVTVNAEKCDFDTIISAISSHQPKFRCDYVELGFRRQEKIAVENGE
ncbi:hypothetical protein TL16_g12313 [Triparma laevis f. inornata]|uniref:PDZ domain-containing protein n=2 Tax=Triparma laevis TaxID=1534972 RepID=A0A9W7E5T7_9STRA|nr:hypothetical protein TrLO_g3999 [Triparma laevis f. longispina]GMH92324.1 hypothetical protein TL16_g12313 [Triparma laevis f. inornata]